MEDFIETAISAIMKHVQIVAESAKMDYTKKVYLMGAENACKVLQMISGNDVVKVIRCKDCKWYDNELYEKFCTLHSGLGMANDEDYCSYAERKENYADYEL
jgi:hypothetical protein